MLADIQLAPGIPPLDPLTIERLRRRAGELGADLGRWNSAKRAEERDRVKHAAP